MLFRTILIVILITSNIACDQSTKFAARKTIKDEGTINVIGDFFILKYTVNEGAFLSLGSNWPKQIRFLIFVILPAIILAILLVYLFKTRNLNISQLVAFSCIVGGGYSNLIDRILYDGMVTDFMNFGIKNIRTGILNFADLSIVIGLVIYVLTLKWKWGTYKI